MKPRAKRGKRQRRREARRLAERIIELSEEGHSRAVIASSTGLTEEFVREALQRASQAALGESRGGGEYIEAVQRNHKGWRALPEARSKP